MQPLAGKIAVVAGATRGAGRGIACMLGEAGATVYCTGRSTRHHTATANRPETIEETAELVNQYGGVGHWAQVDHTVPEQVSALFPARPNRARPHRHPHQRRLGRRRTERVGQKVLGTRPR